MFMKKKVFIEIIFGILIVIDFTMANDHQREETGGCWLCCCPDFFRRSPQTTYQKVPPNEIERQCENPITGSPVNVLESCSDECASSLPPETLGDVNNEGSANQKKKKRNKKRGISVEPIPAPKLTSLDALLADIYRRYVALRDEDFQTYYAVFNNVFSVLQENMKAVDSYYKRYSSRKQFAGSHADKLRIGRPDEFDMDIVIQMPLSFDKAPNPDESDLVMEPQVPGHVFLRGGRQYTALPRREDWEVNRVAYEWRDDDNYILRTKFTDWFKSVTARALNRLPKGSQGLPIIEVQDDTYHLRTRESGPACTLIVRRDDGFQLDVDLVPALKFPECRWPPSDDYRDVPLGCRAGDWLLVPKPARRVEPAEAPRSWRVALHSQEKRLMDNHQQLRQAIRLIKKLRDALEMKEIASYYIKTIFLWQATRTDSSFWKQGPGAIFKEMVRKLYDAIKVGRIDYFWNESNNLIGHVRSQVLQGYAAKLQKLVKVLDQTPVQLENVAKFLLTTAEHADYKKFFYNYSSRL